MSVVIATASLVVASLALIGSLIGVLKSLLDLSAHSEPSFDEVGILCREQDLPHTGARSQFAWRSQSHCQAQD